MDERSPDERTHPAAHEHRRTAFDHFAEWVAGLTGRAGFFVASVVIVILWVPSRLLFDSVDSWLWTMSAITSILAFLLIAVVQNSAKRQEHAMNEKLNAISKGIADLLERLDVEEEGDIEDLKAAVGLEHEIGVRKSEPPSVSPRRSSRG
jgi:low affinity Fe/Cu permease